jgi:RNA polymerase sigma factor (sigma-70 family)
MNMSSVILNSPDKAESLFLANRRLAMWALRRTFRSRPDIERRLLSRMQIEDAEQLAAMALWRCCQRWDPHRGTLGSLVPRAVQFALAAESERRTLPTVSMSHIGGENSRPFEPEAPPLPDPLKSADQAAEVDSLLSRLPERWRLIIELRYGLENHKRLTLREVAQRLGVSRQAVHAIEARALERMSQYIRPAERDS